MYEIVFVDVVKKRERPLSANAESLNRYVTFLSVLQSCCAGRGSRYIATLGNERIYVLLSIDVARFWQQHLLIIQLELYSV